MNEIYYKISLEFLIMMTFSGELLCKMSLEFFLVMTTFGGELLCKMSLELLVMMSFSGELLCKIWSPKWMTKTVS